MPLYAWFEWWAAKKDREEYEKGWKIGWEEGLKLGLEEGQEEGRRLAREKFKRLLEARARLERYPY